MNMCEWQATLRGSPRCPAVRGTVRLTPRECGTLVQICVNCLPCSCGEFIGVYITGNECRRGGTIALPPLMCANGTAMSAFYTTAFRPEQVQGREIELTMGGERGCVIACGVIAPCGSPMPWCGTPWPGPSGQSVCPSICPPVYPRPSCY